MSSPSSSSTSTIIVIIVIKVIYMLILIMAVFFLCWTPILTYNTLAAFELLGFGNSGRKNIWVIILKQEWVRFLMLKYWYSNLKILTQERAEQNISKPLSVSCLTSTGWPTIYCWIYSRWICWHEICHFSTLMAVLEYYTSTGWSTMIGPFIKKCTFSSVRSIERYQF